VFCIGFLSVALQGVNGFHLFKTLPAVLEGGFLFIIGKTCDTKEPIHIWARSWDFIIREIDT
jgi:hypothetical protein